MRHAMANEKNKIIGREDFAPIRERLRNEGRTVVLCHGVFDLVHYGHIEHLQEAKAQGDVLVVSVTAARYVNKGPGRPYFKDQQRLAFLAELECVDYVILSEAVTVHEVVKYVQPDIYVKGQEYADASGDVTGNIGPEQQIVEQYGGRIYFTQGEVYSSTKLLNNFFGALPDTVVQASRDLKDKYGSEVMNQVRRLVDSFERLRVLVVGDIIIDDYVFCKVQGLTTKDAAMSTRYDFQERYAGGVLAIARHLANFAGHVTMLSMMGHEKDITDFIVDKMSPVECRIVQEKNFITPVKKRYLKMHPLRQVYEKLFSVNRLLDTNGMRQVDYSNFFRNLEEMLPRFDLVVACDYGHGLLGPQAIKLLQEKSRFLAVNCQVNSSNYGMNVITKYKRADAFVVDELLVLDKLVAHLLIEVGTAVAKSWELKKHRLDKVEAVDFILDADVEWSGDGSFLVVAMDVEIMVVTTVGKLVDEGWIAVEVEDDWFVFGEEHIVLFIAKTMLMEGLRLKSE